jgi:ribulose-5-phosphate 4-epimerase/fuculose-1-phosphate aldolase
VPTTNPGSNLGNFVPIFPEVGLVQNPEKGQKVARALQGQNGVLLRGHGAVVVGGTIEQAVLRALYLEVESRVQLTSRPAGEPIVYRPEESDLFKETRAIEHPWEYLVEKVRRQK